MSIAIEFKNVHKSFDVWHERPNSFKTLLSDLVTFKLNFGHKENTQVLKNVNLTINKGEFVGIMGRNGVGKSTLLKLMAGIYKPSEGTIHVAGRLAPLLELGAGFVTELSGYDNIFLNAAILGYSRDQTRAALNEIIDFSELGEAVHRPVRKYSSGMLVRLGFSIAVHLNADVLLFDEVLAVGDVGFQAKCIKKIEELHQAGRTIVLVTHSPEQVTTYCNRCILFDRQGIALDGNPKQGALQYEGLFSN